MGDNCDYSAVPYSKMISRKTRKEGRVRRLGRIFDTDHVSVYLIIERYRSNNRSIYDVCLDVQTKKEKKIGKVYALI